MCCVRMWNRGVWAVEKLVVSRVCVCVNCGVGVFGVCVCVNCGKLAMGCNGNIGSNPSSLCFTNGFFKEFVSSVTGDGLRGASPFLVDWTVVRGNVVDATEGEKSSQRIMRWCSSQDAIT